MIPHVCNRCGRSPETHLDFSEVKFGPNGEFPDGKRTFMVCGYCRTANARRRRKSVAPMPVETYYFLACFNFGGTDHFSGGDNNRYVFSAFLPYLPV